jgi:DNA-binding NtrC family response regulator
LSPLNSASLSRTISQSLGSRGSEPEQGPDRNLCSGRGFLKGFRESETLDKEVIRVSFLTQDSGLGDAIARALGEDFSTRTIGQWDLEQAAPVCEACDVLLLDLRTANTQGDDEAILRLMDAVGKQPSHPPMVVLFEEENRGLLFQAINHGAEDSITNPPNMLEVRLVLRRAHRFHAAEREVQRLRANELRPTGRLHELLGTSAPMQELFNLARKIAPCDVNVLVTGETGTGKELLARAIHHLSGRNTGPLVAFSCANLPENLVEDELFGHEKGAFTGAMTTRRGRVEAADHGTLFLDEIGDLGIGLQPKLLRVLQERTFERLGSNKTIGVDIRLICATNRNLAEMVPQGKFREDLFYRLNVVQLHLPPLRERRDDIPLLAQQFLTKSAQLFKKKARRFSPQALSALEQHNWPGNVRELENVVQRAIVLSEDVTVDVDSLPLSMRGATMTLAVSTGGAIAETPNLSRSYEDEVRRFKRALVLRALRECGWRKAECARTLGVARGYLHRLINQLGIQEGEGDPAPERREDYPLGPVM